MNKEKHVMIIAGEPSGDLHGANLVKALRKHDPLLIITGIGGELMAQEGMSLFFHIKDLSVMGFTEVVMQFKRIRMAFNLFRKKTNPKKSEYLPDLLILIDYPGFNLKAAAHAKKRNIPVLYYITPKVWAWNRSRLKKIKKYVDHAALIFPFEEPIFRREKIPATFVGNPLLDYYSEPSFQYSEFNSKYIKIPSQYNQVPYQYTEVISQYSEHSSKQYKSANYNEITIGLLPGSRESEISNLLEIMLQAAKIIHQKLSIIPEKLSVIPEKLSKIPEKLSDSKKKNVIFLVSAASSININKFNNILKPYNNDLIFQIVEGNPIELFKRCDLLIAASGTVTLEAAICGVPMVIIYKTSALTYFLGKIFVKIPYVGLPNIIAKYPIVPELLQNDATPEKISNQVLSMINPDTLIIIKKRLLMFQRYLGGAGASEKTAKIAMQMVKKNSQLILDNYC